MVADEVGAGEDRERDEGARDESHCVLLGERGWHFWD